MTIVINILKNKMGDYNNSNNVNDPDECTNEPVAGESHESMLITTDSFEEFAQEINKLIVLEANNSNIHKIQDEQQHYPKQQIEQDVQSISPTDEISFLTPNSNTSPTTSLTVNTSSNYNDTKLVIYVNNATVIDVEDNIKHNESLMKIDDNSLKNVNKVSTMDDYSNAVDSFDYLHDLNWLNEKLHVFILSFAGKPIYSLHGSEDKLASIFGVMQALVSVVQSNQDTIMSIHANGIKFVFLVKSSLILVAACRKKINVQQIQMKLSDVYNQILSTLTLSHMTSIFEKRKNFDLRRLLSGSERLIDHLLMSDINAKALKNNRIRNILANNNCSSNGTGKYPNDKYKKISNKPFIFLTHSVRILPLPINVRDSIISAIQTNCSKIKNLVFAVLIANNKLIALVRMKKYFIHPADLRLIFNIIECSESFKTAETWTPICLPKFDSNGFLHGHVSYLAEDCDACLILLSVDRNDFFILSNAKQEITKKLRRSNSLKSINESLNKGINLKAIGIQEIRHFLYKSKSNAQLLCSEITIPYTTDFEFQRLEQIYYDVHHRIHSTARPLKLIYEMHEKEILLAWVTVGYELYAIFEPTVDKNSVITLVNQLLKWIKKEEQQLFILNAPTF